MIDILELRRGEKSSMEQFFSDDDLLGLLEELNQEEAQLEEMELEIEMQASNRRYEEIIRKHRME